MPTLFTAFYLFITSPHSFLNSFGEKALQPGNFSSHHAAQDALVRNRSCSNIETKAQRCLQSRGVSDRKWRCEEEEQKCRLHKEAQTPAVRGSIDKASCSRAESCHDEEGVPRSCETPSSARVHALRQHAEQRTAQPKNDCAIQRALG